MEKGKSGQQQSTKNVQAFRAWASSKSDDDFKQLFHRGQLSRTEIARECGFGKSALIQNPAIKSELAELEKWLREKGILPQLSNVENSIPVVTTTGWADDQRVKRLEEENAMLRAEVEMYRKYMKRYSLMERCMAESLRMPR